MFKSLKYRFEIALTLIIAATAGAVWLFVEGHVVMGAAAVVAAAMAVRAAVGSYERLNRNFVFLLNAIENGDYSFDFTGAGSTRRERELSEVLGAIKRVLARAREEEIENERFLSLIVAGIPVGIAIVDERDFVKVANEAALRMLGMHVFTHVRQLQMVDEQLFETFSTLTPGRTATVRVADERDERLIALGLSRIAVKRGQLRVVTMSNIAGEMEAREMESWIKLIRVMTHEIMNSIAPINSLAETMHAAWSESEGDPRLRRNTVEAFETITSTARGLSSFVESYRRFTGIPKPQLRRVKLAPLIERVAGLEAAQIGRRNIAMTVRIDDRAIAVSADEGQIAQVLVNLLRNAAEAIPAWQTDGAIEVRVAADGDTVRVEVSNNGTPIAPEVLPQIFVPFFTTKSAGTGIGLSVSRYIMRLHGGNLKHHADSHRTTFSMVFSRDDE